MPNLRKSSIVPSLNSSSNNSFLSLYSFDHQQNTSMVNNSASTNNEEITKRQLLIEEVKKRPWLYYKNDPGYNERFRVHQSWKEISEIVGWDEEICKSKWRNVRDAYRKIQRYQLKNPNDPNFVNRHPELSFLDDCPFTPRSKNKIKFKSKDGKQLPKTTTNSVEAVAAKMIQQSYSNSKIQQNSRPISSKPQQNGSSDSKHDRLQSLNNATSSMVMIPKRKMVNPLRPSTIKTFKVQNINSNTNTKEVQLIASTSTHHTPLSPTMNSIIQQHQKPPSILNSSSMSNNQMEHILKVVQEIQNRNQNHSVLGTLSNMIEQLPLERRASVFGKIFNMVAEELRLYNQEKFSSGSSFNNNVNKHQNNRQNRLDEAKEIVLVKDEDIEDDYEDEDDIIEED